MFNNRVLAYAGNVAGRVFVLDRKELDASIFRRDGTVRRARQLGAQDAVMPYDIGGLDVNSMA